MYWKKPISLHFWCRDREIYVEMPPNSTKDKSSAINQGYASPGVSFNPLVSPQQSPAHFETRCPGEPSRLANPDTRQVSLYVDLLGPAWPSTATSPLSRRPATSSTSPGLHTDMALHRERQWWQVVQVQQGHESSAFRPRLTAGSTEELEEKVGTISANSIRGWVDGAFSFKWVHCNVHEPQSLGSLS